MGNLFGIEDGILCQQVNCCGVMGAGLAKAIMDIFPVVYEDYKQNYIDTTNDENKDYKCHFNQLGTYQVIPVDENLYVANIYSQDFYGNPSKAGKIYTKIDKLIICIEDIAKKNSDKNVYIPCSIGYESHNKIYHGIKETLPTLNLDLEKCFAICSYVPDEEAQKMVAETFPYHSVIYCDKIISKQLPEYINEIDLTTQKLLESFPGSCLLTDREPIEFLADRDSNTYFILGDCTTKEDIDCKVLEWLSRAACKTQPYDSDYKNNRLHQKILDGISQYFGRVFTQDGMMQIYTYLGNAVNHEKTLLFIRNGFDMDILPIKSTMIESNMGKIPLEDYLDIKAQQCGFKDYKDLRTQGFHLNFNNENKTEEIEDIEKE